MRTVSKVSIMQAMLVLCFLIFGNITANAQHTIVSVSQVTANANQFEKIEFDIVVSGSYTNPYDSKDIAIDMVLSSPTGKALKLPCYFVSGDASSSNWRARLAPREAGKYTYHFEVSKNSVLEASSTTIDLMIAATANDGFLHKNNNWSFKFDNGKLFRGVGENFGWEPRASEQGGYKGAYTYNYLLPKLAANGVNFFRTWMSPWNLPLEWKQVTNTTRYSNSDQYFNPGGIAKMETLVAQCDSLGLYMMLTLDYHGALCFNWNLSNYNSVNGGPIAQPAAFFTNTAAKEMYKNRLRYLVARWGYSTSIGAFEFFNEIDNAMYSESNGGLPRIPDADVTAWHTEMSIYLKSIDPYEHLVTTSISYRDVSGMNSIPSIDFNQKHIYEDPYVSQIDQNIVNGVTASGKPYVIGEYGYRYQDDDYSTYGQSYDFDFKQGMWLGLFKPTPILPMTWWWEMFDNKTNKTKYFNSVKEIYTEMMNAGGLIGDLAQSTVSTSAANQKVLAIRAGNKYFVYVLNNTNSAVSTNITLSTAKNGNYTVQTFDPADGNNSTYTAKGTFTAASNSIVITANSLEAYRERILILTEEGNTVGVQLPYDVAIPLPGILEAENFDKGGEGIAFHDLESSNLGGEYRINDGVDIETCNAGGFDISNTIKGEWVEYTVDVQQAGTYTMKTSISSITSNKKFRVMVDDVLIADPITVTATGGNQIWTTLSIQTTSLMKGLHVLRIAFDDSGINLDKINFELMNEAPLVTWVNPKDGDQFEIPTTITLEAIATDADGTITNVEFYGNDVKLGESSASPFKFDWIPSSGKYILYALATDDKNLTSKSALITIQVKPSQIQLPFPDAATPHAIPGQIEAEDVDSGTEGVAYHDLTPTNIKGLYRTDVGFDIEACTDVNGGFNLADIQATEWVEYSVNVAKTAKYDFVFRVATQMSSQSFSVLLNDVVIISSAQVPNTGNWQSWQDVTVKGIALNEGVGVLKLLFNSEFFNLNYISLNESPVVVTGVGSDLAEKTMLYPNPANDKLAMRLANSVREVRLVNMTGMEVYRKHIFNEQQITISTQFIEGMHVAIVQHQDGRTEYIKILIRH